MTTLLDIENQSTWVQNNGFKPILFGPNGPGTSYSTWVWWDLASGTYNDADDYYIYLKTAVAAGKNLLKLVIKYQGFSVKSSTIDLYTNTPGAPFGNTLPYYITNNVGVPTNMLGKGVHVNLSAGQTATYYLNPKWHAFYMFANNQGNLEAQSISFTLTTTIYPVPV